MTRTPALPHGAHQDDERNDDIIRRLETLARQPVDPQLAGRHLSAMTDRGARHAVAHKLRVVGAFAPGALRGHHRARLGRCAVGPMQEVAHHTLGAVGVDVPRADRYNGPECEGGPFKNHGEYVRSQPKENRGEAATSRCGKPVHAGDNENPAGPQAGQERGDCQGPPAWAGKGHAGQAALARLTPEQRDVVVLRFVADLPIDAVARLTRRSPCAVKALQHRALEALADLLGPGRARW